MPESRLFTSDGHLEPIAFVLLADGELPPHFGRLAEGHLKQCWSCRAEYGRIGETMEAVAAFRERTMLPLVDVPDGMPLRLRARLAGAAPGRGGRWRRGLAMALAATFVLLLLAVWMRPGADPVAPAAEDYLRRAVEAEDAEEAALGRRVLHQKFRLQATERDGGERVQLAYAVWRGNGSSVVTISESDVVAARRLNRLYEANRLDWKNPVSAREFRALHRTRPHWHMSAERAAKGVHSVRLKKQDAPAGQDELLEAELSLHDGEWRPFASQYVFAQVTVAIEETHRDYVDEAMVHVSREAARPGFASGPATASGDVRLQRLTDPNPELTELAVRLAIRELGIGVDEPVTVGRSEAGEVVVEALNVAPVRTRQLEELHHRFPYLLLDTGGGLLLQDVARCQECAPAAQRVVARADGKRYQELERQLGAERLRELSATGVRSVELALAHSLALARLAERYSESIESQLPAEGREILRTLVMAEAKDLESALERAGVQLGPVLKLLPETAPGRVTAPGGSSWRGLAGTIHRRALLLDREVKSVLTSSDLSADQLEECDAQRLRDLKELARQCYRQMEAP